ncbi:MAG: hypothetical protein IPP90_16800 [Gemmatimonadaceae bacterium]|nr:hypothetical protein [Gemmatimonadaceae bacterium]
MTPRVVVPFGSSRETWRALAYARAYALPLALTTGMLACAPTVRPLRGTPSASALPPTALPEKPQQLRFTWSYKDETFDANGEGVVRVMSPDRARLDFFLRNGMAGGYAILVGDSLTVPGIDLVRRFLPPVPLLWATLGRLAVAGTRDTIVRVDGDSLRADLGILRGGDASKADGRAWRTTFAGKELVRVDRIEGGKILEWVTRQKGPTGLWELRYVHERAHRSLRIAVNDTLTVEGFDDAIWRRP